MWLNILNAGMVIVGLALLMFISWAVDKQDKTYIDLDYGDDEEL